MNLETKFDIDDRVEIIEIGRTGSVTGINYDGVHVSYNVRYFDNSAVCNVAFYDYELRMIEK